MTLCSGLGPERMVSYSRSRHSHTGGGGGLGAEGMPVQAIQRQLDEGLRGGLGGRTDVVPGRGLEGSRGWTPRLGISPDFSRGWKEQGAESAQELAGLTRGPKGPPSKAKKSDKGRGDRRKGPPSLVPLFPIPWDSRCPFPDPSQSEND